MQIKSLWIVIIKIAGLYTGWLLIMMIPLFVELIHFWFSGTEYMQMNVSAWYIFFQALIYFLISGACLFKTGSVVNKLKLVDGLEEEVLGSNMHRSTVIKIVVILFGGFMIADGLPTFCRYLASYLHRKDAAYFLINDPDTPFLLFAFLKTVIGYCLMAYSRMVVNFIELRRRKA